jgi:superfamily II DNA or RNA helicase
VIKAIIEKWTEVPMIGLSATPCAKGMGRFWTNLIISATTEELIRIGRLSPFRVFAPSHPDLSQVKTVTTAHGRDFAEGELSDAMQEGTLTADIVSTWQQRAAHLGKTLVYGVDRAHALALHKQFEAAGVRSAYQDGGTTPLERERIRLGFASGEIEVVCNIGTLTTGIDWDVRCIVLARPTKSEMLFVQIMGRGLRRADGKKELLILDHSDTTLRLGFITDIHHATLDDGTPKKESETKKDALPRQCSNPECTALLPKYARKCPACGFEPKPQPREVEVQDGELVELDGNKRNKSEPWSEKIAFMRGLRAYALLHGRKSGWVNHSYRERYGVWPNDSRVRNAAPAGIIEPYIISWVRSRNIKYAKSRDRSGTDTQA